MAIITLPAASLNYQENGAAIALGTGATLDGTGLPSNLAEFELVASLTNALPADFLSVVAQGNVSFDGRIVKVSNQRVGTFIGGVGAEPLVISFETGATTASVEAVLQSLRYESFAENLTGTSDRQLNVSFQAAGQTDPSPATAAISVTGVDDAATAYSSLTLYDSSTGQRPSDGPWLSYLDQFQTFLGGNISATADSTGTVLTTDSAVSGGFSNYEANINILARNISLDLVNGDFPELDRNQGYVFSFSGELLSETREPSANKNNDGKDDRAGFSLSLLSSDLQGIALNFFEDRIWAHEDATTQSEPEKEPDADPPSDFRTLFTQAEGVAYDTTQSTDYDVAVKNDRYRLFANNNLILEGSLRDYTSYEPPDVEINVPFVGTVPVPLPDFNELSSLVFLGDLSPSAGASTKITNISIATADATQTIEVTNGQVTQLPVIQLDDPDGNDRPTKVLLSLDQGELSIASTSTVATTPAPNDPSRFLLEGSLADINQILADPTNLNYQPPGSNATFSGTAEITIEIGDDIPPFPIVDPQPIQPRTRHDFDGDGFSDLLWYDPTSGTPIIWNMDGTEFNGRGSIPGIVQDRDFRIQGTGDFNRDGKTDIVWRNFRTGTTSAWLMDGNAFLGTVDIMSQTSLDAGWVVESVADINQDGRSDLLWRHQNDNTIVAWYLNSGSNGANLSLQGGEVLEAPGLDWKIKGMGDFNGDDKPDILWRNSTNGVTALWYLDGLSLLEGSGVGLGSNLSNADMPGLEWEIQGIGDYNRDGKSDVVWRHSGSAKTVIWLMDNTERIGGTALSPDVPAPYEIFLN